MISSETSTISCQAGEIGGWGMRSEKKSKSLSAAKQEW